MAKTKEVKALQEERHRADASFNRALEYRRMLEWVILALESNAYKSNAYSYKTIIEEIENVLG